ncbi:hypothetical protein [Staphylococcus gallinarum]|uniref:hypothetical protein n=1 Tax=Staphylococcus gallinarum TaxID=1293 RepID=UPI003F57FA7C
MGNLKENERIIEITGTLVSGQRFSDNAIVEIDDKDEFDASLVYEDIKERDAYYLTTEDGLKIYDTKHIESIEIVGHFTEEEARKRFDEKQLEIKEAENQRIKDKERLEEIRKRNEQYFN